MKRVRTTKTAMREEAQDRLMFAAQKELQNEPDASERQVLAEQLRRIERLFGYEQGSWWPEDFDVKSESEGVSK